MKDESFFKNNWQFLIFIILALLYLLIIGISIFNPKEETPITINVVGINNQTLNASQYVVIYVDCIKFCGKQFYNDGVKYDRCINSCADISKMQECE